MRPGQKVLYRVVVLVAAVSVVLASASVAWSSPSGGLINVNTATAGELQALPGIGPKKATAIVSFRSSNGPFKRVDDLVQVKGIGPKTLARLRPLVTCGGKKSSAKSPRRGR